MRSITQVALAMCISVPLAAQDGSPTTKQIDDGVGAPKTTVSSPSSTAVVLPAMFATQMGQSANTYPHAAAGQRYQQVFLGSEIGRPLVVRNLCLRLDEQYGGPAQTQTLELLLGSTKYDHNTVTTSFAGNYNGTIASRSVFKGNINLPQHAGGGTINSWGICFPFTAPFIWTNPTGENLIMEIVNTSASSQSHFEDFCTANCTTTRLYATTPTATTATSKFNNGLIIRLDDGVIPKPGQYTLFGKGCKGSGKGPCVSNNENGGSLVQAQNANIFALAVDTPQALSVTGFRLFTKANGTTPVTLQTQVYLADAAGKPTGTPVRTGTMTVTPTAAFHQTTFGPLAIAANQRFFISYTGGASVIQFPFISTGNNSIHYWHSPTSTAWSGPFSTQRWTWWVDCNSGQGIDPQLTNNGVPEIGKQFDIELRRARANTSALLWFGNRVSAQLPGGCTLYSTPDVAVVIQTDANGFATIKLAVPNNTALKDGKFANQWWVIDPQGALWNLLALTNGGEGVIGG